MQRNLIGAGGFGEVYEGSIERNTVIKAIREPASCDEAAYEANLQRQVYSLFHQRAPVDSVRVARVYEHREESIIINDKYYACWFEMERLYGVPIALLERLDPRIKKMIDPSYRKQLGDNYGVMVQLSFALATGGESGLIGRRYQGKMISEKNPLRGYFLANGDWGLLQRIRETVDPSLPSVAELKRLIGFIYGAIYFGLRIIPRDIEIALGLDPVTGQHVINVLDFGMMVSVDNPPELATQQQGYDVRAELVWKIQQAKAISSTVDPIITLESYCLDLLSTDVYAFMDVEIDPDEIDSLEGWKQARRRQQFIACVVCGEQAHFHATVSNQFFCSANCSLMI